MSRVKGLSRVREIMANPKKHLQEYKKDGRKVIGYLCCFAPPEIIHAAGAIPYRLTGTPGESTSEVDGYLEPYGCPYVRNIFSQYLKGRQDFLDGLVISHSCDMVQRLYGIWTYYYPLAYNRLVNVPHQLFPWSQEFYRRELVFFQESLERFCNKEISIKSLKESIELYNQIRKLLRNLYKLRGGNNLIISSSELMEVMIAGELLPPEEFRTILQEVLEEIKPRSPVTYQARVLVWGSILDHPRFYQIIEKAGGQVVADDTCLGMRFWNEDVPMEEDPFEGLKEHYLVKFQCPRTDRGPGVKRFDYLLNMAKEYQADGIIGYTISFCDPHKLDYPDLRDYLEQQGFPMLLIDDNYSLQSTGAISTRVQAFLEMLPNKNAF